MAATSSSGLTFKLHPLVILNISDHYTRVKSQTQQSLVNNTNNGGEAVSSSPSQRVFGCVIGIQRGRTVEIFNSFELLYDSSTQSLDRSFLEKKQELYKKVFPHFYILGWYSTGSDAEESDMQIHKALMDINESPVYVLLNPSINHAQKDLPVTIFESELHVIDGIPQLIFVRSTYTIETVEAERISVDHVAHLKPADGGSAATQLAAHLTGIHSAIKMLNSRVRVLYQYLLSMQKGDIPCENSLLRQVSSLLRRLPAIESGKFQDDFLMEYNDTLLVTYLAMLTNSSSTQMKMGNGTLHDKQHFSKSQEMKSQGNVELKEADVHCSTMNELVDKINTAYERNGRRGGRTAFI
ncbi:COP9 signalosome complex subunit 6a [Ancistrocladus abbreviatus]